MLLNNGFYEIKCFKRAMRADSSEKIGGKCQKYDKMSVLQFRKFRNLQFREIRNRFVNFASREIAKSSASLVSTRAIQIFY